MTQPPATPAEVLAHYTARLRTEAAAAERVATRRARAFQLLAVLAVALIWITAGSLRASLQAWPLILGFAAAIALVTYAIRQGTTIARSQRLTTFYERALKRTDGTEPQSGRTGIEPGQDLRTPHHLYEHDLNLLGPDSLFGLLATTRTGPGERGIARYLLDPTSHLEAQQRQAAVRELLPAEPLRESIALLGTNKFQQVSASFFDDWLADPPPAFPPLYRIALFITAPIAVVLLLIGLTHLLPWSTVFPNLALALVLQGATCAVLRRRVVPILAGGVRLQGPVKLIAEGLAVLQATTFTTPKLTELRRRALEPAGAVAALRQLESQLAIVEQRPKEYFLLFSLLLAAGTQAAISIAAWKRRHAANMQVWVDAWAEFEALNAIALYAFEHPQDIWPELLPPQAAPQLQATQLAHPLLPAAIPNDIALGPQNRFYLISGSNMAGKSTLLRAIGINAVLAYAGAPVRAQSMRLTPLILGASLALTDSLAEGKSKFLAEVERLSAIVAASRQAPVLFLVDEIFSGTNSHDRRTAAQSVLESLLANGALGALSTHDLALTELATPANTGQNVHMASPNAEDPLAFDYRLKPGVNTSSNALAIIRMLGLEVVE